VALNVYLLNRNIGFPIIISAQGLESRVLEDIARKPSVMREILTRRNNMIETNVTVPLIEDDPKRAAPVIALSNMEPRHPEPHPVEGVDCREKEPVKPARVLVAEDSPDNRMLVRAYLKGSPYQLTFEEDGKAALDRLTTADFDLILMDVRMPVMDGLDATRAIRAIERERGAAPIPIIALTANASLEDMERSRKAGCSAHLSKPISKLELLGAIEKYRRRMKPVDTVVAGEKHPHQPVL
jgi:CheY-like chemotaxis protein